MKRVAKRMLGWWVAAETCIHGASGGERPDPVPSRLTRDDALFPDQIMNTNDTHPPTGAP